MTGKLVGIIVSWLDGWMDRWMEDKCTVVVIKAFLENRFDTTTDDEDILNYDIDRF